MKQAPVWQFFVVTRLWTYIHNQTITTVLGILLPAVSRFSENLSPPQKSGKQIHFKITVPFQNPYYCVNTNIPWCFGKCVFLLLMSFFPWKTGERHSFTANSSCAGLFFRCGFSFPDCIMTISLCSFFLLKWIYHFPLWFWLQNSFIYLGKSIVNFITDNLWL